MAVPIACAAPADVGLVDAGLGARLGDVDRAQVGHQLVEPVGVLGEPGVGEQTVLHEDRQHRRQQVGVATGPRAQVDVGQVGRLGASRVDDDQRAGRVVGELLEDPAGLLDAVRLPRVLAPEHADLGVLEVGRGVTARTAEQLAVDPELTGLLLGECVRRVADAERRARRPAVPAAEVVALPAAAVEEDLVAAVLGDDVLEALRDLGDRGVPVDRLERAVGRGGAAVS